MTSSGFSADSEFYHRDAFYRRIQSWYARTYWSDNDGTDLFRPNGFPRLPEVVYRLFAEQITHGGKILDLGCGNGLMLKCVMDHSRVKLVPYGVDWLDRSIRQAQQVVLPEFAANFSVANLVEYDFPDAPYDYIFLAPDDPHPADRSHFFRVVADACAVGGRVVFYCYRDVLDTQQLSWAGEMRELTCFPLVRVDREEVSLAVFHKQADGKLPAID